MRTILKFLGFFLILLAMAGGALVALNWQSINQLAKFSPVLLPPLYGKPANKAEAQAQDLRYLRKLIKIDRSFTDATRREFTQTVDELEARVGTLSDADFYVGISKAVAIADNGHTSVSDQPLYRHFKTIGAKLYWFSDGLFIVRAAEEHADTVEARITAIDGTPIEEVVRSLARYRGGVAQWRRLFIPMMIEAPEILHAAGLAASNDGATLSLQLRSGGLRDITFKAMPIEDAANLPRRRPWMTLKPEALPGEGPGWTRAFSGSGDAAPLYLRNTDAPFFSPLPGNGHYIRTQTGFGTKTQSVPQFYEAALAGIADGQLDYLVVDSRWNAGGDYTKSIDFAKTAPNKIKAGGKLYLAVGPQTFSAALVTVAMLKYYGGGKSVIIGAAMGDREQFWAETGLPFVLPNSKFRINYATGYHDWNKGCAGHPYCFTENLVHQVPAGSLMPTIVIEPTFADYASGRDLVLERILAEASPD